MARCAQEVCRRWRPDALVRRGSGVAVENDWYCSRECLRSAVEIRLQPLARTADSHGGRPPVKTGILLMAEGRLSRETLVRALESQRRSGRRIGAELIHIGAVTELEVLHALARQGNTKYLTAADPSIVHPGHGGLSPAVIRALGLVPFASDEKARVLKVAYTAPVPRTALTALRELTGWIPDPYLVNDAVWPALAAAYGVANPDQGRAAAVSLGWNDALSRIAQVAERGHRARIGHARLDAHVWVRVETTGVEDVLMAVPEFEEEPTWQADSTSH
jgi:hypothetical protein